MANRKEIRALIQLVEDNDPCSVPDYLLHADTPEEAWSEAQPSHRTWLIQVLETKQLAKLDGDDLFDSKNRSVLSAVVKVLQEEDRTALKAAGKELLDSAIHAIEDRVYNETYGDKSLSWTAVRRKYAALLPRALAPAKPKAKAKGKRRG